MNENSSALAEAAPTQLRNAFESRTSDWPEWFIGIDCTPTKHADATATIAKPHGGHVHLPIVVWRNKREKAKFYITLSDELKHLNRIGVVIPHGMRSRDTRQRLFEKLIAARKQFLYQR